MGSPKIITLETGADAAQVAGCLKAMGQWVQPAQGDGVQPVLLIEPHSANCTRESLLDIAGVADVMLPKSGHPKLDALRGQAAVL